MFPVMVPSFHTADRQTFRRVVMVGLMFCAAFVAVSLSSGRSPGQSGTLVKAGILCIRR